jgi:hypothetical protein
VHWSKVIVASLGLLGPIATANPLATADAPLTYETIEPARIRLHESATIRVTSVDGYLKSVPLPKVPGLAFEDMGKSQGLEFVNGQIILSTYILIRVTPQFTGIFSIPGLTPKSKPLGLEVLSDNEPNPYAWHDRKQFPPPPSPAAPAALPKGVRLEAGGAAFVQLVIPKRAVYVGESVPVDVEVGLRPEVVTSLNGLPVLKGDDLTLNYVSRQPERRERIIEGSSFLVMTWHSVLAPVKPGNFSLSVETPLSVKINTHSADETRLARQLGWPFLQSLYSSITPKDIVIASPAAALTVLPLPTEGRPRDFTGAVGDFQISSDVVPARTLAGDPVTLRLHISGVGNFDRVDAPMFDHLDQWKTYTARSTFALRDAAGYRGEKVFEQPLIAAQSGVQSIPGLEFSYFNPDTRRYERAHTPPLSVTIADSLADSSLSAPGDARSRNGALASPSTQGLRPDHPEPRSWMSELRPLYLQGPFLAVPATVALLLAGGLLAVRPHRTRFISKATGLVLAQLEAAARSGDSASFFELARKALLQAFAARWQMPPDQITLTQLKARLGTAGADIELLFALADEAKYSPREPDGADFQRWLGVIRGQLASEGG